MPLGHGDQTPTGGNRAPGRPFLRLPAGGGASTRWPRNAILPIVGDSAAYLLGHSDHELRRLECQARLINPMTRRFVEAAGVSAGMRVLDVGSGAGDVSMLLADLVGPGGEVIGFDRSRPPSRRLNAKQWLSTHRM